MQPIGQNRQPALGKIPWRTQKLSSNPIPSGHSDVYHDHVELKEIGISLIRGSGEKLILVGTEILALFSCTICTVDEL